jgi:hypothetical protein
MKMLSKMFVIAGLAAFVPAPVFAQSTDLIKQGGPGHNRTHAPQQIEMLIDHLVSKRKQPIWDIQTECLRGLAVDHELELCRLDNWKVDIGTSSLR